MVVAIITSYLPGKTKTSAAANSTCAASPTVIDWEYARYGDPAYEFAIVTRGVKRPFQTVDGLERLLDAYQHHGGQEVRAEHVHIHELAMIAGWYRTALNERGRLAAAQELERMRGLLRRLR